MALINHRAREIHFKIVYYGPGLGGKTTNLRVLHDRLPPERRGKMISIATDHERTLFFDFLPLELGQVNGFTTRFHLYTVPGQVYYRLSRRAVLQGVDGIVFVADSHPAREQANRESLRDLHEHLATMGLTPVQIARLPRVFQYNKRDLDGAVPAERLRALLNPEGAQEFEAVASEARGVAETLKAVCKLVLARLTTEAPVQSSGPMPFLVIKRPGRRAREAAEAAAAAEGRPAAPLGGTPASHPVAPAPPWPEPAAPSAAPPQRFPVAPLRPEPAAPSAAPPQRFPAAPLRPEPAAPSAAPPQRFPAAPPWPEPAAPSAAPPQRFPAAPPRPEPPVPSAAPPQRFAVPPQRPAFPPRTFTTAPRPAAPAFQRRPLTPAPGPAAPPAPSLGASRPPATPFPPRPWIYTPKPAAPAPPAPAAPRPGPPPASATPRPAPFPLRPAALPPLPLFAPELRSHPAAHAADALRSTASPGPAQRPSDAPRSAAPPPDPEPPPPRPASPLESESA